MSELISSQSDVKWEHENQTSSLAKIDKINIESSMEMALKRFSISSFEV